MSKKGVVESIYPLSPLQQGMLFHTLYAPASGIYVEQMSCDFRGDLDIPAFLSAWQEVLDRHPVLRTAFNWERRAEPFQVVYRQVRLPCEQYDWRALTPDQQQARLAVYYASDRQRGFKLTHPPLLRLALFHLAPDAYHFVWSHHHLLLDGWSIPLVLRHVFAVYEALCRGQEPPQAQARPYRDYIAWLQQQDFTRSEAFWRQMLQGFTSPTRLGVDRPAQPGSSVARAAEQQIELADASSTALQAFARQHRLTLTTLVQGAWALLLGRYSDEDEVVFGITVAGRPPELTGVETMVGLFINTLPLRVYLTPSTPLLDWLLSLQAQLVELRQYEHTPLVKIQGWSDVPRGVPLFESLLVVKNYPVEAAILEQGMRAGPAIEELHLVEQSNYPLTLGVTPGPELMLKVSYDVSRFDGATIARMAAHFTMLLEGFLEHPARRLDDLPMLTAGERRQMLVDWNATDQGVRGQGSGVRSEPSDSWLPVSDSWCIHQLFEAQAARMPDAVALVFNRGQEDKETRRQGDKETRSQESGVRSQESDDAERQTQNSKLKTQNFSSIPHPPSPIPQHLSYGELDQRANQLARHLRRLGVRFETRVGLCIERSLDLVVGLLGTLKAGGAYVPLDPAYPPERLRFMLADAQAAVLITTTDLRPATCDLRPATCDLQPQSKIQNPKSKIVNLDADWPTVARESGAPFASGATADNLAYVIYTSGSTGLPKGVAVPHRGLLNLVYWHLRTYDLSAADRVTHLAGLGFDASVWELWLALAAGARLALPDDHTRVVPDRLRDWLVDQAITICFLPTPLAEAVLALEWPRVTALRCLLTGGDQLRRYPAPSLPFTLVNHYGPTEYSVVTTAAVVPAQPQPQVPPIGRPIANTHVYVLDRHMQPVPVNVPGELYLGGDGLARGYFNRPDLTAERFIPNPFAQGMGDGGWGMEDSPPIPHPPSPIPRLYRTGDLVRWRVDGELEFLGRIDHQVKIRGFRIELGEIEAVLNQHPAICEGVVLMREDTPGVKRLVAYVVQGSGVRGQGSGRPPTGAWQGDPLRGRGKETRPAPSGNEGRQGDKETGDDAAVTQNSKLKTQNSPPPQSPIPNPRSLIPELRDFLKERLPDYMVPAAFVVLDSLPLTPNHEVNRRALPAPERSTPASEETFAAPRIPAEATLVEIWSAVLGHPHIGIHDNFFALGGDSILSIQIIARAHAAGLHLTPEHLFQHQTIAELAQVAGSAPQPQAIQAPVSGPVPLTPIQYVSQQELDALIARVTHADQPTAEQVQDIYALSPLQQGMLFHSLYTPTADTYFQQIGYAIHTRLNVVAFERAWQAILERHPVLRSSFHWDELRAPVQMVHRQAHLPIERYDWRALDPAEQQRELEQLLAADRQRGFDLTSVPALRLALVELAEEHFYLVWSHHHILLDGWSAALVLKEVLALYEAFGEQREIDLGDPYPYRVYIDWLQRQQVSTAEAFWRERFKGFSAPTPLPLGRPGTLDGSADRAEQHLRLLPATSSALLALARQQQITLNTVVQGVWALLLSHYSGEEDVVFGATFSGRPPALVGVESIVGLLINTLPVRVRIGAAESAVTWLQQLQSQQIAMQQYEHSSLVQIRGWMDMPRGTPLFESLVIFENYPMDEALRAQNLRLRITSAHIFDHIYYPLTLVALMDDASLTLRLGYERRRFDGDTIARLLGHMDLLLESFIAAPLEPLSALPTLTADERDQILTQWNATGVIYPAEQAMCLHQLFEAQVARTPDAVALVFDRGQGSGVRGQETRRQGLPRVGTRGDEETRSQESGVRSQESEFLAPSTQHPAPNTQHPAPNTRHPAAHLRRAGSPGKSTGADATAARCEV